MTIACFFFFLIKIQKGCINDFVKFMQNQFEKRCLNMNNQNLYSNLSCAHSVHSLHSETVGATCKWQGIASAAASHKDTHCVQIVWLCWDPS